MTLLGKVICDKMTIQALILAENRNAWYAQML